MPMDWMQIVNAHVKWKARLHDYLEGKSEEKLDPAEIARDDACVFGEWIYGEGKQFENFSTYASVKADHALFHQHAAEIVRLMDANQREEAEKLLGGEYARLSQRLKHQIITLYQEMNGPHS